MRVSCWLIVMPLLHGIFFAIMSSSALADDAVSVMVVSGCGAPRVATRGFVRHQCVNRRPTSSNTYRDICTDEVTLTAVGDDAAKVEVLRPEWDTVPVAEGRGMDGVHPWGCTEIRRSTVSFPRSPVLGSLGVAALHGHMRLGLAKTIGSGVLIGPRALLTARHVAEPTDKIQNERRRSYIGNLAYATFGFVNQDLGVPLSHDKLTSVPVVVDSQLLPKVLFSGADSGLDYSVVELETAHVGTTLTPATILNRSDIGEVQPGQYGVAVLGYTDNPFFPRGLVLSSGGRWRPRPLWPCDERTQLSTTLWYDVNTAPGFSGGALLDGNDRFVGIHLAAHSVDSGLIAHDCKEPGWPELGAPLRDFSRPNGGLSLTKILEDIANRACPSSLDKVFGVDVALAVLSYRTKAPDRCTQINQMVVGGEKKEESTSDVLKEPDAGAALPTKLPAVSTLPPFLPTGQAASLGDDCSLQGLTCKLRIDRSGRKLLPKSWNGLSPTVGAIIRVEKNSLAMSSVEVEEKVVGTGVLVAPDLILTAGHVLPLPAALTSYDFRFVLGWRPKSASNPCRKELRLSGVVLAASSQNWLDYALMKTATPMPTLEDATCGWRTLKPYMYADSSEGLSAYAIGHYDDYDHGSLSLFFGGKVLGGKRWSKDGGGTYNLDYDLFGEKGLSGGAVFDSEYRWIALHQRNLSTAREDVGTRWNPYSEWHYGSSGIPIGLKPSCNEATRRNHPADCFPSQGTLISDIANDIARQKGYAWLCTNLKSFAEILPPRPEWSGRCERL